MWKDTKKGRQYTAENEFEKSLLISILLYLRINLSHKIKDLLFKILFLYNRVTAIYPVKLYIGAETYFKELKVPVIFIHMKTEGYLMSVNVSH